jgi:hypothetical protein
MSHAFNLFGCELLRSKARRGDRINMEKKEYFPLLGCTNIAANVDDLPKLYLMVDLKKPGSTSSSGKTKLTASSHGSRALLNSGITISGNVYFPVGKSAGKPEDGTVNMLPGNHAGVIKSGKLYLEVDVSKPLGDSKSGNTKLLLNVALFKIPGTTITAGLTMFYKQGVTPNIDALRAMSPNHTVELSAEDKKYLKAIAALTYNELDKADNVSLVGGAPLRVRINLSKEGKVSASEKSRLVASTHGGLPAEGYRLSVNMYFSLDKESGAEGALEMVTRTPDKFVVSVKGKYLYLDFTDVEPDTTVQFNSPVHGTAMTLGVRATPAGGKRDRDTKGAKEAKTEKEARKESKPKKLPVEDAPPPPPIDDVRAAVAKQLAGLSSEALQSLKVSEVNDAVAKDLKCEPSKALKDSVKSVIVEVLTKKAEEGAETSGGDGPTEATTDK